MPWEQQVEVLLPALERHGVSNTGATCTFDSSSDGVSLYIWGNPALVTLGTAFRSLRRIPGTLVICGSPLLTDFEALRNLTCHGGVYQNNPSAYCHNCPGWLLSKPWC